MIPTALTGLLDCRANLLRAWLDASAVTDLPGGPELNDKISAAITQCEQLTALTEGNLGADHEVMAR